MAANYHLRDITQQIFEQHPNAHLNEQNEPVVPADDLFDVFDTISERLGGGTILSDSEREQFIDLCTQNRGLEVTPEIVWKLIEARSTTSPPRSPRSDEDRGHDFEDFDGSHSRAQSNESYGGRISRPPSRGPTTPNVKSPLDSERRQRSTPLNSVVPPSSWSRPTPHHRRKSDAGSRSDSESQASPSAWASRTGRNRAPSNPTSPSPTSYNSDFQFPPNSPGNNRPASRPSSRGGYNSNYEYGYMSNDDNNQTVKRRPRSRYGGYNDSFDAGVSSLPMPRTSGPDSDDDENDASLVQERQPTLSMISMEEHERMEALQRANEELTRKLAELRDTLERRIAEHEQEMLMRENHLEELKSELLASNREEKELRAKDARNMAQITALEADIAKTAKALELSKNTYSSLQKQYQEQTALSERYREDIRRRDETIRSMKDAATLQEIEISKWAKEHEIWEERIRQLETELSSAIEAHSQLDEQKHENLLLKETIDRMRFEIDTMRDAASSGAAGSGLSSAANTISKSLGAELQGKMNWDMEEEHLDDSGEMLSEGTAVAEEEIDSDQEEEDIIQTIITKKKRKVASRANVIETRRTFEEVKEYSDNGTQYDATLFSVNHGMQTEPEYKPKKASFSIQTDEMPQPKPVPPPTPRITVEMEIQTETAEEEVSAQHDESLASSSSTVVPVADVPTPKGKSKLLDPLDDPPTYNQATEEERAVDDALKKWHGGARFPFDAVPGGVSEETLEDWKALKQELGVDCLVIDKIIANTLKAAGPSTSSSSRRDEKLPARRSRFYNIYNTYVYGEKSSSSSIVKSLVAQGLMVVGASALVMMVLAPQQAHHYAIPGGPTYYDRAAWSSFNTMGPGGEGFGPDGTAAVWNFLGRLGGGAARIARGWPT
ncbi:hypothetical protein CVT24_002739 [Panaeolus cyanescens]|uniref:Uncharacterized protein n=1 Tax=Panaeolus cyanescens TaxID=181874 RepID=A0A409WJ91_9AGAR|nr:hypothetical protein CVT24_002739 [Panaeolus cyanescens]